MIAKASIQTYAKMALIYSAAQKQWLSFGSRSTIGIFTQTNE